MSKVLGLTDASVNTRKSDQNERVVIFVGTVSHQIVDAKLPSLRQVLKVFFYNMRYVKLSSRESARLTIDAVLEFWQQARIPNRKPSHCIDKLLNEYKRWANLRKTSEDKRGDKLNKKITEFLESLDDLFDIAAANALTSMNNEEDKEFLQKQRQKGRPGSMLGIDMKEGAKKERARSRTEKEEAREAKYRKTSESQTTDL